MQVFEFFVQCLECCALKLVFPLKKLERLSLQAPVSAENQADSNVSIGINQIIHATISMNLNFNNSSSSSSSGNSSIHTHMCMHIYI